MPENGIYANCYKIDSKVRTFALRSSKGLHSQISCHARTPFPLSPCEKPDDVFPVPLVDGCDWNTAYFNLFFTETNFMNLNACLFLECLVHLSLTANKHQNYGNCIKPVIQYNLPPQKKKISHAATAPLLDRDRHPCRWIYCYKQINITNSCTQFHTVKLQIFLKLTLFDLKGTSC